MDLAFGGKEGFSNKFSSGKNTAHPDAPSAHYQGYVGSRKLLPFCRLVVGIRAGGVVGCVDDVLYFRERLFNHGFDSVF